MMGFPAKKQCERCGARPAAGKLFRIPWTGDCLCKDCIDRDNSLQRMFAEINSMVQDRHTHDPGIPADPHGMDMPAFVLEPDSGDHS